MHAARWLKASLTTSLCLASTSVLAQVTRPQLQAECIGETLAQRPASDLGDALHRRTPDQTWERMRLAIAALEYRTLGDSVLALWDTLRTNVDPTASQRMTRLLERQRAELMRLDTDPEFLRTSGPTARFFEITVGDDTEPWLVNGGEPDSSVALTPGVTTLQTARAVCWTALLARKVADSASQQARTHTRQILARRAARWDNFERFGYSLTPLELLINGWCGFCRTLLEPPRVQLIAVHVLPTYAVRDELGNRPALTTELAGLLVYNSSRSFHLGFSYAFALPTEERRESGWVLHVGRVGQVGLTFRNDTYRRENASVLLSADLYRFIETWQGKLRDERDAIGKAVQKLGALR